MIDDDDDDNDDDTEEVQLVREAKRNLSEVEEVSAPARPSQQQRVTIDDELEITGTVGDTLAAALPHSRGDCPLHKFVASRARKTTAANEQHCEKWCVHPSPSACTSSSTRLLSQSVSRANVSSLSARPLSLSRPPIVASWCYVCQVPAQQCRQWASPDPKVPAHCNAYGKLAVWVGLRKQASTRG